MITMMAALKYPVIGYTHVCNNHDTDNYNNKITESKFPNSYTQNAN